MPSSYPISRILKLLFVPADLKRRMNAVFEYLERQIDPSASITTLSNLNDSNLPDGTLKFIPDVGFFYLDRSGSISDGFNTLVTSSGNGIWVRLDEGEVLFNGAYREVLPSGQPAYTSDTWYTSPAKTQKIREELITRNMQGLPTSIITNLYNPTGSLYLTITDALTYDNNVESSRTRTVIRS